MSILWDQWTVDIDRNDTAGFASVQRKKAAKTRRRVQF
jgi:hypothetical protein